MGLMYTCPSECAVGLEQVLVSDISCASDLCCLTLNPTERALQSIAASLWLSVYVAAVNLPPYPRTLVI